MGSESPSAAEGIQDEGLSVPALFAAVAAVASGVVALNATGVVGQIERNFGTAFFLAIGAAVLGTLLSALVVSGLLGRDPDAIALRTAAGQAASEARDLAVEARDAWAKAQGTGPGQNDEATAAAQEALDAADQTIDPLRRVADAAERISHRVKSNYARERELRQAIEDAYTATGRGNPDLRRRAAIDRDEAIEAARLASAEARERADAGDRAANEASRASPHTQVWGNKVRRYVRIGGTALLLAGVLLACGLAIAAGGQIETPVIDVTITRVEQPGDDKVATRTYDVDAETRVNDLDAEHQVTILVDGLRRVPAPSTEKTAAEVGPLYSVTNLFHGKYGPDNDGKLDVHARVRVTRGPSTTDFDAIGVQAYVSEGEEQEEENACASYPQLVSKQGDRAKRNRAEVRPGCVVLTLPSGISTDEAVASQSGPRP